MLQGAILWAFQGCAYTEEINMLLNTVQALGLAYIAAKFSRVGAGVPGNGGPKE